MKNIITLALTTAALSLALPLSSCSSSADVSAPDTTSAASAETPSPENKTKRSYIKPGASVTQTNTLPARVEAGSSVTFELKLSESYDAGTMSLDISGEGVSVLPVTGPLSFDLAADGPHTVNVALDASVQGLHYVNINASVTKADGQSINRAMSIPVQVGDPKQNKARVDDGMTHKDGVIEMPADEVIK